MQRPTRLEHCLLAAVFGAVAAACAPPDDRGLTRPEAVPATAFEQRDVSVQGIRLRYLDEGPYGAAAPVVPAVLILPGHTARIEDYDALVPSLAHGRRVLLPDLPGKGYSDKPVRRYDFTFYEEITAAFLDAVDAPRIDAIGGSLGGNLALRLAHRFPARVERVAAWAPGSAWEARPRLAGAIRRAGAWYGLVRPALWLHSGFWFSDRYPGREAALREKSAHHAEVMGPGFAAMYVGMAADAVGSSLFDLAPEIAHPTLLVVGSLDEGAGVQAGIRRLHDLLPRSELVVIPNAGHSLVAEAPVALGAAVLAFLEGREPASRRP